MFTKISKIIAKFKKAALFSSLRFKVFAASINLLLSYYSVPEQKKLANLKLKLAKIELKAYISENISNHAKEIAELKHDIEKKKTLILLARNIKSLFLKEPYNDSEPGISIKKASARVLSWWFFLPIIFMSKQKIIAKYANKEIPKDAFTTGAVKKLAKTIYEISFDERLDKATKNLNKDIYPNITDEEINEIKQDIKSNILKDANFMIGENQDSIENILKETRNKYKSDNKAYLINYAKKAYLNELHKAKKLLSKLIIIVNKNEHIENNSKIIYNKNTKWYNKVFPFFRILWAKATKPILWGQPDLFITLNRINLIDNNGIVIIPNHFGENLNIVNSKILSLASFDKLNPGIEKAKILGDLQYLLSCREKPNNNYNFETAKLSCCKDILVDEIATSIASDPSINHSNTEDGFYKRPEVQEGYLGFLVKPDDKKSNKDNKIVEQFSHQTSTKEKEMMNTIDINQSESDRAYGNFLSASKNQPGKNTEEYWFNQAKIRISMAESLCTKNNYKKAYVLIVAAIYILGIKCKVPYKKERMYAVKLKTNIAAKLNNWRTSRDSYELSCQEHIEKWAEEDIQDEGIAANITLDLSNNLDLWSDVSIVDQHFSGNICAEGKVVDKTGKYKFVAGSSVSVLVAGSISGPIGAIAGLVSGVSIAGVGSLFVVMMPNREKDSTTEKLEKIIQNAINCYKESDFEGFLEALSEEYFANSADSESVYKKNSLIKILREQDETISIKDLDENFIVEILLEHGFRPDDIAYLVYFISNACHKINSRMWSSIARALFKDVENKSYVNKLLLERVEEMIKQTSYTNIEHNIAKPDIYKNFMKAKKLALTDYTTCLIGRMFDVSIEAAKKYINELEEMQESIQENFEEIDILKGLLNIFGMDDDNSAYKSSNSIPGLFSGMLSDGSKLDFAIDVTNQSTEDASTDKFFASLAKKMEELIQDENNLEIISKQMEEDLMLGKFIFSNADLVKEWQEINENRLNSIEYIYISSRQMGSHLEEISGDNTYYSLCEKYEAIFTKWLEDNSNDTSEFTTEMIDILLSEPKYISKCKENLEKFVIREDTLKDYFMSFRKNCSLEVLLMGARAMDYKLYIWHYTESTDSLSLGYIDEKSNSAKEIHIGKNPIDRSFKVLAKIPENLETLSVNLDNDRIMHFNHYNELSIATFNILAKELAMASGMNLRKELPKIERIMNDDIIAILSDEDESISESSTGYSEDNYNKAISILDQNEEKRYIHRDKTDIGHARQNTILAMEIKPELEAYKQVHDEYSNQMSAMYKDSGMKIIDYNKCLAIFIEQDLMEKKFDMSDDNSEKWEEILSQLKESETTLKSYIEEITESNSITEYDNAISTCESDPDSYSMSYQHLIKYKNHYDDLNKKSKEFFNDIQVQSEYLSNLGSKWSDARHEALKLCAKAIGKQICIWEYEPDSKCLRIYDTYRGSITENAIHIAINKKDDSLSILRKAKNNKEDSLEESPYVTTSVAKSPASMFASKDDKGAAQETENPLNKAFIRINKWS